MSQLPKDPMILLSYINTQLRDFYPSLEAFCDDKGAEQDVIEKAAAAVGYVYDPEKNRFV